MGEESRAGAVLDRLFAVLPSGAEADVRLRRQQWGTMRFANSRIHQPHRETVASLSLRVALAGRLGTATTTDLSSDGVARLVGEAASLARAAPVEKRFAGFSADGRPVRRVPHSEVTGRLAPEQQADLAGRILAAADRAAPGARVSGVVNTGGETLVVRNTSGLDRSTRRSLCQASVLVERLERDPPASGWSETAEWDAARLRPEDLGREAAERVASVPPAAVPPGKYRVVLRGSAVAELLGYLGHIGFGGSAFQQGWSCLRGKLGRRIAPQPVHLVDDATSPASLPQSIDFEGTVKEPRPLIDHGVARGPVTDLLTAARLRKGRSTGHALPPEAPWGEFGPQPTHQLLEAGDASEEELVRATGSGILVTRFWYVRVVQPGTSVITGMTRDGTYEIGRGELTRPIRNLRFTESILGTLASTELLGRVRRRYSDERGLATVTCPALLAGSFRFTSATLF